MTILEIIHFILLSGLGAFLSDLIWAEKVQDLYNFKALKNVVIGFIVGYLYHLLYQNYGFPDLVMAMVAGYFGKDLVEGLFESLRSKLFSQKAEEKTEQ
jgi:uncharacterized membrane protein YeaQ/YmgE (transglycosylase-associated protein family)